MLRLFPLFAAFTAVLLMTSCKEEIEFNGDFEETAVVYGLLDQADTIHYIKITRVFGGSNNSLEVAQIEDSSYFTDIVVVVDELVNGSVARSWTLNDTTLTNKEEGVFYSPDQKVYYFKTTPGQPLISTASYRMTATINGGEYVVKGTTQLVQNLSITSPSQNAAMSFATSNVSENGYNTQLFNINSGNAERIDLRMKVYFDEFKNGVATEKSFTWKLGEVNGNEITPNASTYFYGSGNTFYTLVKQNVTEDPLIDKRELTRVQIIATGGSEDLNQYILLNEPSSSLAQNKPIFTNLTAVDADGNERKVIGLFSSRATVIQEKPEWVNALPYYRAIDNNSTKELCAGTITGALLFCSDHPSDVSQGLPYVCQ